MLLGCGYRTDYYRKRYKNKNPNESCNTSVVSTYKLYKKISVKSLVDNKSVNDFNKIYLKFYTNCKVGVFYNFSINNAKSLEPEKADMGFYYFKNEKLFIKTYFDHPQGGGFLTENFTVSNKGDTLILENDKFIDKYLEIPLSTKSLEYEPDW